MHFTRFISRSLRKYKLLIFVRYSNIVYGILNRITWKLTLYKNAVRLLLRRIHFISCIICQSSLQIAFFRFILTSLHVVRTFDPIMHFNDKIQSWKLRSSGIFSMYKNVFYSIHYLLIEYDIFWNLYFTKLLSAI